MTKQVSINEKGWVVYKVGQPNIGLAQFLVEETMDGATFRFVTVGHGVKSVIRIWAPVTPDQLRQEGTSGWQYIKYRPLSPNSDVAKKRKIRILKYKPADSIIDAELD